MIPQRPYLVRAIYQWVVDNGMTPHVVVNAALDGVQVPAEYVHEGQIVLNLNPSAVKELYIGNDRVDLSARFGGVSRPVSFPIAAVLALYARETGQGMIFAAEGPTPAESSEPPEPPEPSGPPPRRPERPTLKVVK